jgi:hypothetical protein
MVRTGLTGSDRPRAIPGAPRRVRQEPVTLSLSVLQTGHPGFALDAEGVQGEGDEVVLADEHGRLDELALREVGAEDPQVASRMQAPSWSSSATQRTFGARNATSPTAALERRDYYASDGDLGVVAPEAHAPTIQEGVVRR